MDQLVVGCGLVRGWFGAVRGRRRVSELRRRRAVRRNVPLHLLPRRRLSALSGEECRAVIVRRFAIVAFVAWLAPGCASYGIRSADNEATFYRARYVERCVTTSEPGVPCQAWSAAQRKLDKAVHEANDAMK